MMACPVYFGIAGWSYPDWEGIVYTDPKADQLEYVSGFVDCIEINNTFYRPPVERMTQSWLQRPIFAATASGGHFGRTLPDFTWERTDQVEALQKAAGRKAGK